MLTREENELLCRVTGDAAMGSMFRRYWLPAVQSAISKPAARRGACACSVKTWSRFAPPTARVGLLDENCPHRGASLVLANNVDCALQCLYHGWKIAPSGQHPRDAGGAGRLADPGPDSRAQLSGLRSGRRRLGLSGAAGARAAAAGLPHRVGAGRPVVVRRCSWTCNWAQGLEGVIDSAHSNYLHSNAIRPRRTEPAVRCCARTARDRPPVRRRPAADRGAKHRLRLPLRGAAQADGRSRAPAVRAGDAVHRAVLRDVPAAAGHADDAGVRPDRRRAHDAVFLPSGKCAGLTGVAPARGRRARASVPASTSMRSTATSATARTTGCRTATRCGAARRSAGSRE